MADDAFRVLLVCTANLCRSPMAEYLFRDAVRERWALDAATWVVMSAGTRAEPGLRMHPRAERALARSGVDVQDFRSRRISREMIDEADLVLTAERVHRAAVVTLAPRAVRHTFTIRQFARMTAGVPGLSGTRDPVTLGRDLVEQAISARSRLQPLPPHDEDIPDPIGRRSASFRRCARSLTQLISAIMSPLDTRT